MPELGGVSIDILSEYDIEDDRIAARRFFSHLVVWCAT